MHELPITKNIFEIVLKHTEKNNVEKVKFINLEIGALSDLQSEWIQRYFDQLSKDSVVEGAQLKITRVPAIFKCIDCKQSFEINSLLTDNLKCTHCKSKAVNLVSGREYNVKSMEAI